MIKWKYNPLRNTFALVCALDVLYYNKWINEDTEFKPEEKGYFIKQRLKRLDND